MVANWSTHKTDWKNYAKLNLTKARNTGNSNRTGLFPFLKALKAEIIFPYTFGKEKGNLSSTLHSLQGKTLPIVAPWWSRGWGWLHVPLGLLSWQCGRSSENELRKERIIWNDGKYYLPLLKHRVAYCFFQNMQHHLLVISVVQAGKARLRFWLDGINQSQQQKKLLFPVTHKITPSLTFLMNVGGVKCLKCEFSQSFRSIPPADWQCYFNQTVDQKANSHLGTKALNQLNVGNFLEGSISSRLGEALQSILSSKKQSNLCYC